MKDILLLLSVCILSTLAACQRVDCRALKKSKSDCICPMIYDPVCGCNKVTYSNSCEASCHGITKYTKGTCP